MSFDAWAAERRQWFESHLLATFEQTFPEKLRDLCRYPLATGGKRFRPLLCFAACEAVGGRTEQALPAALALELVHSFSLVHDDLPCMDNDDERRGRPTVHALHGEAVGLLVGDALLAEAFLVLGRTGASGAQVADLALATGAGGMVAGQYLDITATPDLSVEALTTLHRAKTGALIRAAARMGGRSAGADAAQILALDAYGDAVGLAFQLQDDVLDADEDQAPDGPPSFVKRLGLAATRALAQQELHRALASLRSLPHPEMLAALARFTVERSG